MAALRGPYCVANAHAGRTPATRLLPPQISIRCDCH
jgi:hypothetical protein